MKNPLLTGIVFMCFCFYGLPLAGQNIFVLEKANKKRIINYTSGQEIILEMQDPRIKISGRISQITDSSLIINERNEVFLNNIAAIQRKRWGFGLLQRLSIIGGIAYLSISSLNRTINNEYPVVSENSLLISSSMLAVGVLMTPLSKRTHSVENGNWKVLILDFSD